MAGWVDLYKCLFLIVKWFCRGKWVATRGHYRKFASFSNNSFGEVFDKIEKKYKGNKTRIKSYVIFYVPTRKEEKTGKY